MLNAFEGKKSKLKEINLNWNTMFRFQFCNYLNGFLFKMAKLWTNSWVYVIQKTWGYANQSSCFLNNP